MLLSANSPLSFPVTCASKATLFNFYYSSWHIFFLANGLDYLFNLSFLILVYLVPEVKWFWWELISNKFCTYFICLVSVSLLCVPDLKSYIMITQIPVSVHFWFVCLLHFPYHFVGSSLTRSAVSFYYLL